MLKTRGTGDLWHVEHHIGGSPHRHGHNHRIAFGLTIFPIDQEDLYVYEKAGGGYRYQDRVETAGRVEAEPHRT